MNWEKKQKDLEKSTFKQISKCVRVIDELESKIMVNRLTKYTHIRMIIESLLYEVERLEGEVDKLIGVKDGE